MLTLPALKIQQFSQEFFLLNLSATDVRRLVRFEVLGQAGVQGKPAKKPARSLVNWAEIEQKVETSEKAYQRPILRKKIDELAHYYLQCRDDGAVPSIPGAVLLTTDEPVTFRSHDGNPFVGIVELAGEDGSVRVLDGQHRLLALAALVESPELLEDARGSAALLQVPAILFTALPAPVVVEMFVTINSKHTRLNPSLLLSLKGKQLYSDPLDARIHDVVQKLNDAESSPLRGQIKMLGVGPGKVAQAGLAQELKRTILAVRSARQDDAWLDDFEAHGERFYLAFFKQVAKCFPEAWDSKKHSILSLVALRAFIQASQPVIAAVYARGGDPRATMKELMDPWTSKIGSARFETTGQWRQLKAGGGKETTRRLARELMEALEVPS